jgi:large subunit ribosomal protein L6e
MLYIPHTYYLIHVYYTGPYGVNGVPLRRVNQKYVIATSTSVPMTGVNVSAIDDKLFAREKASKKKGAAALEEAAAGAEVTKTVDPARAAAQKSVDAALEKNVSGVTMLKEYLKAKFTLSKNDKPHLMAF